MKLKSFLYHPQIKPHFNSEVSKNLMNHLTAGGETDEMVYPVPSVMADASSGVGKGLNQKQINEKITKYGRKHGPYKT